MGELVRYSGVILFTAEGNVAFERRGPHEKSPGRWSFIGGGALKGELPHDTIRREIIEETGLDPDTLGLTHVRQLHIPPEMTNYGDEMVYDLFRGRLPQSDTPLTVDGRDAVVADPSVLLSDHRGRFTTVAGYVLTQTLHGVLSDVFEYNRS